jgi:putative redox protein
MSSQRITFSNQEGYQLAAYLEKPADGRAKAYALFAHCFTCNKNLKAVVNITRALTQAGFAVMRFDFTGLGESEGDFADTNFSSNIEDLVAAAHFMEQNYQKPQLLIGHSLGGTAVLIAAQRLRSVRAIVTLGAPAEPEHVTRLFNNNIEKIHEEGKAEVSLSGRPFTIKKQFLEDLEEAHQTHSFKKINRPILIMHSPADQTVSVDNAKQIYEQVLHPKSFISLDQADHLLSQKEDSQYAGNLIASWVSRYIATHSPTHLTTDKQVVTRTADSFTTEIMTDEHALLADEPLEIGGDDLGPSPYELLSASLGACTGMTLRMYANHKKWPLKEVKVHLHHEKIHAKDCKDGKQKIDKIEREIELEGDLSDDQRQRLLEIANKCPVHKTLHSPIKIESTLKAGRENDKG